MIGICLEAETTCTNCALPVPMNALTKKIICTQCLYENTITVADWKNLLEDVFIDAVNYEENEGVPSTIFGSRNYKIIKGRQMPKFSDTKTYIDMDLALSSVASGKINNPETNITYSIRKVPAEFKDACPVGTYLLCEDLTQLPSVNSESKEFNDTSEAKLIPFTCPNCAGSLEITGKERTLKCKFCGTESYISDNVWQKMHPVKAKQRFYFCFDEKAIPFDWEHDLWDMVADANGILYISIAPAFSSDDQLWIVALNPDQTVKWKRTNLKFKNTTIGGEAQLEINTNKELVIWSRDRNTSIVLATTDGTDVKRLGKKRDDPKEKENTLIDFTQCNSIAADVDGNYVVMVDRNTKDSDNNTCYEFMKMDTEGNLKMPWNIDPNQGKGLFAKLGGMFFSIGDAAYVEKMKDKPTRFRENDLKLSIGIDGSYYFRSYKHVAKCDRTGKVIYNFKIEDGYSRHKLLGDKDGNAYYVYILNDKYSVIKVSPDGAKKTTLIDSVINGGGLCKEDHIALSANGTIICSGYGGRIRRFNMDGKLLSANARSLEEEKDELQDIKDMED